MDVVLPLDLNVPEEQVQDFLSEVERRLLGNRSKTAYGRAESEHFYYAAAQMGDEVIHAVVVLPVRRDGSGTRVLLDNVRQPNETEWTELGLRPQVTWTPDVAKALSVFFQGQLASARVELGDLPTQSLFRRGILVYDDGRGLGGEYRFEGWRIGPPSTPPDCRASRI